MITRRQAILALALSPAAKLAYSKEPAQAPAQGAQEPANPPFQPPTNLTDPGITSWDIGGHQRPYLQLTLTKDPTELNDRYGIDRIVIVYGADKVEIAAKDIWEALQPPKANPNCNEIGCLTVIPLGSQ